MAKYLYDGNLNEEVNKRSKNDVTYYIRGTVEVNGKCYERYAIQTHFVQVNENINNLIEQYVMPLYEEGDILSMSEKVISMCQGNVVHMEDMKLSWVTKLLSRLGKKTSSGIGITEPYKLQLMIDLNGWPKVLYAGFCGLLGKLVGKRGVFYEILGKESAGIDGFYDHSAFETYHTMATLIPKNPNQVCESLFEKHRILSMIVDCNDIDVDILGKAQVLSSIENIQLENMIRDNPAGQDDELTPFILIRDITGKSKENYVPKQAIEKQIKRVAL